MSEYRKNEQVLDALRVVIDPDLGMDIVSADFIKELVIDDGAVSFTVELTTPACPLKASFKQQCELAVKALSWVSEVVVNMSSRPKKKTLKQAGKKDGLANVTHIIGVSSCKGGVGKSTLAVNLAYAVSKSGAAVGLLDADVYGPSLPTLVSLESTNLGMAGDLLVPLSFGGVKLMSFGFAASASKAAIMRGPMVSGVIHQLACDTDWGHLDYLIVDMPPGTGDIQLTLTQQLPFTGAVIVTTPQQLSFVDVVKGMQMFDMVKVPTLAVVENMSYFICHNCDEKHRPFGSGALKKLVEQYGIENTFELPILSVVSELCDAGQPAILAEPHGALAKSFQEIADSVVRQVAKFTNRALSIPEVDFDNGKGITVNWPDGVEKAIVPKTLRLDCACALCKDENTGEQILRSELVADDVVPVEINKMGNYAVAISWSDGHNTSIYPYKRLKEI